MKKARWIACLAAVGLGYPGAEAQLEVPRGAFRIADLEKVQQEAALSNRAITFLFTNSGSACGLCIRASQDTMQHLINRTSLVFVDQRDGDFGKLPRKVQQAMNSEAAGSFIPKTVIMDPALEQVIDVIPYIGMSTERDSRLRNANRKALEAMREIRAAEERARAEKAAAEAAERLARLAEIRTWTTAGGQTLEAKFTGLVLGTVHFADAQGNPYRVHINQLTREDQIIARELGAAAPR